MTKKIDYEIGSGNIYKDLGFERPDEELLKADIAALIYTILQQRKLTQKAAADILGVDQPKISALKNGHLAGFSIERLFSFLLALNQDIDVVIKPRSNRQKGAAGIHVMTAP